MKYLHTYRSRFWRSGLVGGLFAVVCLTATTLPAQTAATTPTAATTQNAAPTSVQASAMRSVDGRVVRPMAVGGDTTGMGPAAGAWVVLHRVGREAAGPVDSARSSRTGQYNIRWRAQASDSAVYFASVTWNGIAYFSSPLRQTVNTGDDARIVVFDTTSVPHPMSLKGRHLIVGMPDSLNMRTIIEVFELQNDSLTTVVSLDAAVPTPTWSIAVPSAARDVHATQGDVPDEAMTHTTGRVSVFAPIAPGLKQVAFTYKLHSDDFPLQYRAEYGAVVFEVLLEEPEARVFGDGFQEVDAVTLENRRFKRYLSQDVSDGSPITVEVPSGTPKNKVYGIGALVAVGFLLLLFLTRSMQRRANKHVGTDVSAPSLRVNAKSTGPAVPLHDRLAQEIVALDTVYARQKSPSASVTKAYEQRRAELKDALAEALASGPEAR